MADLNIVVVGSGGREYELARQMAAADKVRVVYVMPGNAGTAALSKGKNIDISPTDIDGIVAFVRKNNIEAVIIGPDSALAAGLADAVRAAGCLAFGPSRKAAQLEASKAFATDFMQRHQIPQPQYWTARSQQEALDIIKDKTPDSYVLKADGLASGKGVVLPQTGDEAETTISNMFSGDGFEGAGKSGVVIQERLHGPEVSAFAVSDGSNIIMLPFAQDHKRLKNGDEGPNTGGMGAYAPVPDSIVSPGVAEKIHAIAVRTIEGMAAEGTPYQGVLYLGLMLAKERNGDPVVIEYNSRFGDPETQVVLPLLSEAGFDVADMLWQAARGDISGLHLPASLQKTALTVCLAAEDYPVNPRKGDVILGLDSSYDNAIVQLAGVKQQGDKFVTAGGRVLYITGLGATADLAAQAAYGAIGPTGIHFDGMQFRTDIGFRPETLICSLKLYM
jgi:phosphoribosylamine--glycine ligase